MRYFIEISYNGTAYHGWQKQPNATSVQEVVEDGLKRLLGEAISVLGAGRTDTGVHAKQMIAHFDSDSSFVETDVVYKLNAFLPEDIAVHSLYKVRPDAHARFDALSRTYLYRISLTKNPFSFQNAYFIKYPLNIAKMQQASQVLLGYKDFQCFSKSNTDVKTYYCNILKCDWILVKDELHLVIKADRFLRNMVRAIVGTMINIGTGKLDNDDLYAIIASKNRSKAGYSVPAHGLYLTEIEYPENIKL
ncbi:tRNA pseudouridine(38-40) synthase TruA [Aestuariivivens sediminicola]|uniref:tRNA pseudouridine(38-40) synthase TruA n=1 Tax=Aestuariivivens sediminicola TaxID=2913560 RepID=UPI001F5AD287|nr:tRNA pseudouridine(38-40) synthase TruA [Aestuariivivens sediminicola]